MITVFFSWIFVSTFDNLPQWRNGAVRCRFCWRPRWSESLWRCQGLLSRTESCRRCCRTHDQPRRRPRRTRPGTEDLRPSANTSSANGHFQSPVPTFETTLLLLRHSLSSDSVWRLSCSGAHTRTYWFNICFFLTFCMRRLTVCMFLWS